MNGPKKIEGIHPSWPHQGMNLSKRIRKSI